MLESGLVFHRHLGVEVRVAQELDLRRGLGFQLRVDVGEPRPLAEVAVVEEELVAFGHREAQADARREAHLPALPEGRDGLVVELLGHLRVDEEVVVRVGHDPLDFGPRRPEVHPHASVHDEAPVTHRVLEEHCAGRGVGAEDVLLDAQLARGWVAEAGLEVDQLHLGQRESHARLEFVAGYSREGPGAPGGPGLGVVVVPAVGAAVGQPGGVGRRVDGRIRGEVVVAVDVGVHAVEVAPDGDLEPRRLAQHLPVEHLAEDVLVGEDQVVVQVVDEGTRVALARQPEALADRHLAVEVDVQLVGRRDVPGPLEQAVPVVLLPRRPERVLVDGRLEPPLPAVDGQVAVADVHGRAGEYVLLARQSEAEGAQSRTDRVGPGHGHLHDVDVVGLGEGGQVPPFAVIILGDALEHVVPLEARLPLDPLAALLGRDPDHAAHRLAVLGVETAGEDLDLVDDRGVDLVAVAAAGQGVVHVHAVDHEHGVVGAPAPDVDLVVLEGDARLLGDHVHHLVQGHGLHLAGRQEVGAAGAVHLHQGPLGRDLQGLDHDDLDIEVEVQVDHLAGTQGDRLAADAVGDVAGLDGVGARAQAAQDVETVGEGHGAQVGARDEHVGVGHGLAGLGVEDAALDGGRLHRLRGVDAGLRQGRDRRGQGQEDDDQTQGDAAAGHGATPR